MTAEDKALGIAAPPAGGGVYPTAAVLFRPVPSLLTFSRRKPIGAAGALILLIPVAASVFLPGLDAGLVHLPRVIKYGPEDYIVGKHILEAPSWNHPMGTDQLGRDLMSRLLYGSRISY